MALIDSGVELLLIPSCRECNCILGNVELFSPESRGFFLHEKLAKRYEKVCKTGTFDDADLKEFGPNLRKYLRTQNDVKTWVERRLSFTGRFQVCETALLFLQEGNKKPKNEQKLKEDTEILQRTMQN